MSEHSETCLIARQVGAVYGYDEIEKLPSATGLSAKPSQYCGYHSEYSISNFTNDSR
jgi:hypothetical protein